MMNRSFRVLGLKEGATKEDVKAAYEHKVSRYKGPDYAEDPEYVAIKLQELNAAYEEAYALAGYGGTTDARPVQSQRTPIRDKATVETPVGEINIDFSQAVEKLQNVFQQKISLPKHSGGTRRKSGNKLPFGKKLAVYVIVSIAVLFVAMVSGILFLLAFEDDGMSEGYKTIYDYNYDEILEEDWDMSDFAWDSRMYLYEGEMLDNYPGPEDGTIEDPGSYRTQADQFAQNYWQCETVEEVTQNLCDNYPGFESDPYLPLNEQLDAIFYFYEFLDIESALWYRNPYSNKVMYGYGDYLEYLNQYWEDPRE